MNLKGNKVNKKRKVTGKSVYLTEKELDLVSTCIFEMGPSGHDYPFSNKEWEILQKTSSKIQRAEESIKEEQSDD